MRERYGILGRMAERRLSSVQAKLDRSKQHIKNLGAQIDRFDRSQPYRITEDHNPERTEYYLRFALTKPFPALRWAGLLGDAIQNMRSALDHLIYAIAIAQSGYNPPPEHRRLMFPVLDPPRPLPMNRIASLSKDVRAAVQREQPDPANLTESNLWRLDQLNLADKHRLLHPTLTFTHYSALMVKPSIACTFTPSWNLQPLDDRAPLLRLVFDRVVPEVEMGSHAEGLVCIQGIAADGQPNPSEFWVVGNLLTDLHASTRGILDRVAEAAGLAL